LLGPPVYAVAVTLTGFLVFAGLGSAASRRLMEARKRPVGGTVSCLALLAGLEILLLGEMLPRVMALTTPAKVALALGLIAPLAFCMGMPFPWAMRRLGREASELIPWAWG